MKLPTELQEKVQVYVSYQRIKKYMLNTKTMNFDADLNELFDSKRIMFLFYKPFLNPTLNLGNSIKQHLVYILNEIFINLYKCVKACQYFMFYSNHYMAILANMCYRQSVYVCICENSENLKPYCAGCFQKIKCDVGLHTMEPIHIVDMVQEPKEPEEYEVVFKRENNTGDKRGIPTADHSWDEFFRLLKFIVPDLARYRFYPTPRARQ